MGINLDRVGRDRTSIKEWQALINTLGYGYRILLVVNHEMLGYSFEKADAPYVAIAARHAYVPQPKLQ
jgi:hypothetical protein